MKKCNTLRSWNTVSLDDQVLHAFLNNEGMSGWEIGTVFRNEEKDISYSRSPTLMNFHLKQWQQWDHHTWSARIVMREEAYYSHAGCWRRSEHVRRPSTICTGHTVPLFVFLDSFLEGIQNFVHWSSAHSIAWAPSRILTVKWPDVVSVASYYSQFEGL